MHSEMRSCSCEVHGRDGNVTGAKGGNQAQLSSNEDSFAAVTPYKVLACGFTLEHSMNSLESGLKTAMLQGN